MSARSDPTLSEAALARVHRIAVLTVGAAEEVASVTGAPFSCGSPQQLDRLGVGRPHLAERALTPRRILSGSATRQAPAPNASFALPSTV